MLSNAATSVDQTPIAAHQPSATARVDVRLRIFALWIAMLFIFAYVDLFSLYRSDVRADIANNKLFAFDINQTFLLGVTIFIIVPSRQQFGDHERVRDTPHVLATLALPETALAGRCRTAPVLPSWSMELDDFNDFCGSLTATTHVIQWGDAHVWKVGGKVFAIGGWSDGGRLGITFKTTPDEFDFLIEIEGVRPAPYLASRGFTWVQDHAEPGLDEDDLREQIIESHRLVGAGLSKRKQNELGLA